MIAWAAGAHTYFTIHCCLPPPVQVGGVPPSEAKVFSEYLLPSLSLLPSEAELAVQVSGWLADTAFGLWFLGRAVCLPAV